VADDWVETLARRMLDGSADIVGGGLRLLQQDGSLRVIPPSVDYWHRQSIFGGNCGVTRAAWEVLNGFDERLRCCEDTDLAWRAADRGLRITILEDALVNVRLKKNAREFVQRFRWGFWGVQLLRKHDLSLDHLPTLRVLRAHKSATGYAWQPEMAAFGQWFGQWWGRCDRFVSTASSKQRWTTNAVG
jgi:GT2 family glycosyltransferase